MHNDFMHFQASYERYTNSPHIKLILYTHEKLFKRYNAPQANVVQNKVKLLKSYLILSLATGLLAVIYLISWL